MDADAADRAPPWARFHRPHGTPPPRRDHVPDCQDCWAALVVCEACGRPVCPTHHPELFRCPTTEGPTDGDS